MSLDLVETGSFAKGDVSETTDPIRVLSWNIARGSRLEEIIEFLRSANAHVICLQETDHNVRRTGRRNIAAEIASALRMNYAFGVEFEELTQGSGESPAYHGQATLSPFCLDGCRILRFQNQSRFWIPRWWIPKLPVLQRRVGGRMALVTSIRLGPKPFAVYNLHLESRSERVRRAQLAELLEDTRRYEPGNPIIMGGDFNFDLNRSPTATVLDDMEFHNPLGHAVQRTTPSNHLGREGPIDWVLIKGPLRTLAARVECSVSASDHYPLSLTLGALAECSGIRSDAGAMDHTHR